MTTNNKLSETKPVNRVSEMTNDATEEADDSLWCPKYLSEKDRDSLYGQALAQLEAAIVNTWLNLLAQPNDGVRLAAFREARAAVKRLEADWDRVRLHPNQ